MLNHFKAAIVLSVVILVVSCQEKKVEAPSYLIDQETMVDVMVDMHLVETAQNLKMIGADSTTVPYHEHFESIFESRGLTKTDFDSSLFYYTTQTEQMPVIYDKILEELYELEAQVKADEQPVNQP